MTLLSLSALKGICPRKETRPHEIWGTNVHCCCVIHVSHGMGASRIPITCAFGETAASGVAGSPGGSRSHFQELPPCSPQRLHWLPFPPATPEGSSFLTSLLTLVIFCFILLFLIVAVLMGVR